MFPIGSLSTEDLLNLNNFNVQSFVDSALSFEITSGLTNLPNLTDYDIDEQLPITVNSSYTILHELSTRSISVHDLSLSHLKSLTSFWWTYFNSYKFKTKFRCYWCVGNMELWS